ncbi:DUF1254 domain-containing protein [Pseudomonas sp. N040]|uniref:DUF1254 domain-containing protein n=1 Tax=Pseudomonas sp. N040 TaxID=2785325 RepID=UPI0018A2DD28|nr:DUF1214 domain-containing protein [Pseudomonas sp. N040]MBF7729084.1 DUF1254 domain-containing protein [Pseudomonas sp. N040]MBW7012724.1 DUF1214 domain-containing protein [Pseudomonas sp. N040]
MTAPTKSWPRNLRRAALLLLAALLIAVLASPSLRNKAGCLLFINGVSSASCVVPMPYRLPDEFAEAEAFALGYQAYVVGAVYARSQILMEKDTNPDAPLNAPLNAFNVYPGLATPAAAIDFTPNNDTVYGLAWLDLSQGPVLMTIPETPTRYWTVQATDWALNTFAYVGKRVHSAPGTYAYVAPGWQGELPAGVTRLESPTNGVFLQARTVVKPEVEADIAPVVAQLKTYRLQPLNADAQYPLIAPGTPVPNPKLNNPLWQSLEFYSLLNRAWSFGGVRAQDQEVVGQFAKLGIGPGLTFDPAALTEAQRKGLQRAVETAYQRVMLHGQENGEVRNGWRFATNLGAYGNKHLLASAIGLMGYGANRAEEALYLPAFLDHENQPLVSERNYRIHFSADNLPPVNEFWSITLYSRPENQLKANPLNRYAFGDRTPGLKRNADGSIDIHVQQNKPEGDAAANWLPSGESGPIWLILRMYGPQEAALSGKFVPPPVERVRD